MNKGTNQPTYLLRLKSESYGIVTHMIFYWICMPVGLQVFMAVMIYTMI
jgi:hypothetical protein